MKISISILVTEIVKYMIFEVPILPKTMIGRMQSKVLPFLQMIIAIKLML
ncbi:hypothetical protein C7972_13117 [Arenibacter sp. ARW7G5Y1]|nr:hypothetical protein C7972_13117 [Arenibacter sp. ARW7G5Y1]